MKETELLFVCKINSQFKISKRLKNNLRGVLKAAVDYYDFARAGLIVRTEKTVLAGLRAEKQESAEAKNKEKKDFFSLYLEELQKNPGRADLLALLQPSFATNIPVVLRAFDPLSVMEVAVFNLPFGHAPNLPNKALSLGRHIANLLQESLYRGQKNSALRKLSLWMETVGTIKSVLNIKQVLHIVAQLAADIFNARCAIFLFDEKDGTIIPEVAVGSYDPELRKKFKAQKGLPPYPAFLKLITDQQPVILTPDNITPGLPQEIVSDFAYSRVALFPLVSKEGVVGVLQLDRPLEAKGFDAEELAVISALAKEASIAIENARLVETLEQKERLLQQILAKSMAAQEEERKRLASEIHDGVIQALLGIWYRVQKLTNDHTPPAEARQELLKIKDLLDQQIKDIRKIIYNLRPVILDAYGLGPAIRTLLRNLQEESEIKFELAMEGPNQRLPAAYETNIYRILQELLANVIRHSQATRAQVILINGRDKTVLVVKDNGIGFTYSPPARDRSYGSLGLASIQERVHLLGGNCQIESRLGWGTTVTVTVPAPTVLEGGAA
ncbi:MAG: GAF domain-containing sensor histidine kinase [Desulfotomaculales bacterium]